MHFLVFDKLLAGTLLLLLLNWTAMGQYQQGSSQFPFGNIFASFPSFFGQSSNPFGNQNHNPSAPSVYNNDNSPKQSSNPTQSEFNNFPGFSSWPFGSGNGANNGGLSNPWQGLFGNNPFNPNHNNYGYSNQNQDQNNKLSKPSQNQNQDDGGQQNSRPTFNQQYPFGFPFANPFFPQYNNQPQPSKESSTDYGNGANKMSKPNINQGSITPGPSGGTSGSEPVELEVVHSKQDSKHPSLNVPLNPSSNSQQQETVPPAPEPIELEVVHSKQDSKHPSLSTAPPVLEEADDSHKNFDESFLMNPEVVDVRLTDSLNEKPKNQNYGGKNRVPSSSGDDVLLFQ